MWSPTVSLWWFFLWCYDDAYDEENDDAIDDDSNDNDNVMIKLKIDGGEECKLKK